MQWRKKRIDFILVFECCIKHTSSHTCIVLWTKLYSHGVFSYRTNKLAITTSFHADLDHQNWNITPYGRHAWFPSTNLWWYSPEQITPASRKWLQLWLPTSTLAHCRIPVSFPKQLTSSRKIGPSLWIPKKALRVGIAMLPLPKPRSLHVVWASTLSQRSWQTVPHRPLKQISTLPSHGAEPPVNRISPFVQLLSIATWLIWWSSTWRHIVYQHL